jgi:predicted RNA-binding protein with PUA-like domain
MAKRYWLFKSEPDVFSYDHLEAAPDRRTIWEGVRNYQARNLLRDEVKRGDGVLFYHSRAEPMAIVGLAKVVAEAHPDPTQFDPKSKYYDEKATPEAPRWVVVDIEADRRLPAPVTRDDLRGAPELADMMVLRKGARLSIQPVTATEWKAVIALSGRLAKTRG